MSYLENQLEPGEKIVFQAHVHRLSYVSALIILAALMTPGKLSGLASTQLALTDRRVIGKVGALARKAIAFPLKEIEVVRVSQGIMGRLFDYGTITLIAKGQKVAFKGIAWPLDLQQQIEEAVEVAILGRKLSQGAPDAMD